MLKFKNKKNQRCSSVIPEFNPQNYNSDDDLLYNQGNSNQEPIQPEL